MSKDPTNDLIHAVRKGNVETAKTLIATFGLCFSEQWSNGYDLLCEALRNKQEEMAKFLLTSGSSVNRKNNQLSDTPLHLAVKNNYPEIVSMLLDRGANINAKNHSHETPLHVAVDINRAYDIVKMLLEASVDTETRDRNDKSILFRTVEIDARLKNGRTPLHIAASKGVYAGGEYVKLLVNHGADIEATDEDGLTPLHLAVMGDDVLPPTCPVAFLELGANIDAKDKFGKTALHYAASRHNIVMIDVLLSFHADPNARCNCFWIPIDYGDCSHLLSQELLAAKALDPSLKDSHLEELFNESYYQDVFESMETQVAEMKIEKIGESNVTYYNFLTCGPKQLAAYGRNESIVERLEETARTDIFHSYSRMIERRLKRIEDIQKKQSLLNSSLKSLHKLSGFVLPDLPGLEICKYLTIHEMENLIKADPSCVAMKFINCH